MTKGEKLIWSLFEFVRELMPATAENTARQNEWVRVFQELEHAEPTQPPGLAAAELEADERAATKRKK